MRRALVLVLALVIPLSLLGACAAKDEPTDANTAAAPAAGPPTGLDDPQATGEELARRWLDLLKGPDTDTEALGALLAPNFQLVRDDGTRATREEYLAEPATVNEYEISDVQAIASGDEFGGTITVSLNLTVDEIIEDKTIKATAPRLGSFVWLDGDWRLLNWSNFGTLDSAAEPAN